jgi:hypothetical protein
MKVTENISGDHNAVKLRDLRGKSKTAEGGIKLLWLNHLKRIKIPNPIIMIPDIT